MDDVNNVKNLALYASLPEREFNPRKYGDIPKPINVGASMMIAPEYYVATGWVGSEKKTEFFSADKFGLDSARVSFAQMYYAAGLRGISVKPLYDLRRYH